MCVIILRHKYLLDGTTHLYSYPVMEYFEHFKSKNSQKIQSSVKIMQAFFSYFRWYFIRAFQNRVDKVCGICNLIDTMPLFHAESLKVK